MPSRFPGMDPFIEGQSWRTFHNGLIINLLGALTTRVRPDYIVEVEERVYLEYQDEEWPHVIGPDIRVLERSGQPTRRTPPSQAVIAHPLAPVVLTLPEPVQEHEVYLSIRKRAGLELVTIIEVLSPTNKRLGSDGRADYLRKREAVLDSDVHLVELDLLRGGERLPTVEPLPLGAYYVFVCRGNRRRTAEVYAWSLEQRLPTIPIPLAVGDPDVSLDLQDLVNQVYDLAGFDYALDYTAPLEPPVSETDAVWLRQLLDPATPPQPNL